LTKFRSVLFAAVTLGVLLAPLASAQTYTISTYSGNGQLVCNGCNPQVFPQYLWNFQPLVAKVVDASGQPAPAGTLVDWGLAGAGFLAYTETVTDANGLTENRFLSSSTLGSPVTPLLPIRVLAGVGASTATFYETQVLSQAYTGTISTGVTIVPQNPLSGQAGSPASGIVVTVWDRSGGPVSGVEVRLVNSQSNPSVACATGTGADPGTVLTDSTGQATCTPILAGSGTGVFLILVGGVADNPNAPPECGEVYADGGGAAGYYGSASCLALSVTPAVPASLQLSGGGQSANPGQTLYNPLTATVNDTNGNLLAGQTVNWTVSPATAGTFGSASAVSGSNGQVQTSFTLSASASGTITITAAIAGTSIRATFPETAVPLVTLQSLLKVSGDSPVQSVASGQSFPNPLVVQVLYNTSQPASGVVVNFSVSGPASVIGSSTPTTDSSGRASVSLLALNTTSTAQVNVTASVSGLTAVGFQLLVIPAGPTNLTFFNAADRKAGSISPCSLATVTGIGLAPSIQGTIVSAPFGPAPTTLQGDSISFATSGNPVLAPIFSITNDGSVQSLTFQVPCEVPVPAATATGPIPSTTVGVTINVGGGSATVNVPVLAVSPGVYGAVGTDGVTRALLARPDGSFVSLANPARRGETVTAYVTGLGPTTPAVATNQIPPRGTVATVNGIVVPGVAGGGAALYSLPQLAPDLVGVYEVSFVIPATVGSGSNVGFSIGVIPPGAGVAGYSSLMYIPVGQ
jgi:uncharacterized protein (TIGR03437 family)